MSVTILRPRQRVYRLGGISSVTEQRPSIPAAAANWWDALTSPWAVYQPKGAQSFASGPVLPPNWRSLKDLSGNGNDATTPDGGGTPGVGGATDWDTVNGWIFNGVDQYLKTTFVPQNDQSQTILVQYTAVTNGGVVAGQFDAYHSAFRMYPAQGGSTVRCQNGWNAYASGPPLTSGNLAIAGAKVFRDGVDTGAVLGAWAGGAVTPIYIGCQNTAGTGVPEFCAVKIQAVAICDVAESPAAIAATVALMAAL